MHRRRPWCSAGGVASGRVRPDRRRSPSSITRRPSRRRTHSDRRHACRSTDAREALSCPSALDDHEAGQLMVEHDDVVFRALVSDDPTWEDADAAETPVEDDSASAMPFDAGAPETDNMLTQYFGEVRRFALLSF